MPAVTTTGLADTGAAGLWSRPVRMPMSIIMTHNSKPITAIIPATAGAITLPRHRPELCSGAVRHLYISPGRSQMWEIIIILIPIGMCTITAVRMTAGAIIRDAHLRKRDSGMGVVPMLYPGRRAMRGNGIRMKRIAIGSSIIDPPIRER